MMPINLLELEVVLFSKSLILTVKKVQLKHLFGNTFCNEWLPLVRRTRLGVCVSDGSIS